MRRFLVLLLLIACGKGAPKSSLPGLVQVSGESPFPAGCADIAGRGVNYPGSEVEPQIAVNPRDPANLIATWQQDRWSNGGAKGVVTGVSFDAGHSWARTLVPFSK